MLQDLQKMKKHCWLTCQRVWALGMLRSVLGEDAFSAVIVTDRDMALMNAISSVFPSAIHLLCRWHINRNALAKCKKLLEMKEKWDMFNAFWNMLVFSSTEDHYNLQFNLFLKEFIDYLEVGMKVGQAEPCFARP